MDYEKMLDRGMGNLPKDFEYCYRFEIPKIKARALGNKTLIENFKELASYLNREEDVLSKHFIKEMGTSGHLESQGLILNGKFSSAILNRKLVEYCKKYIICKKCQRPDTKIINNGKFLKCEACGFTKPL